MKTKLLFLVMTMVIAISLMTHQEAQAQVLPADSLALVALYNATDGPNWSNNTNWLTGPVDTWFGVSLLSGRVHSVQLFNNNLTGSIPAEIGDLTALGSLNMQINQLNGPIPPSIGNLTGLGNLNLLSNQLSGNIPSEIGNLLALGVLNLDNNQLTGSIPTSLFSLPLTSLSLSSNQLTGTIPAEIGNLLSLFSLSLRNNQFTGAIPDEIANLTTLTSLQLSGNQLTGSLTSIANNLTQLTTLGIASNQFSGSVPVELNNLTLLSDLRIQQNNFSDLPDLTSLSSISFFSISENRFTFEDLEPNSSIINENFGQQNFGNAQNINLNPGDDIVLDPPLPGAGVNDIYQWEKDLVDIPGANDPTLNIISATNTNAGSYRLKVTNSLFPGLTLFSEPIEVTIGGVGSLQVDSLALVALYNATDGPNWTNNTNWLTGPINTWFGVQIENNRVSELLLINNNLVGTIPSEIGNLNALKRLYLIANNLSGNIPPEIGDMVALNSLYLSVNQLTGPIPAEIGNLVNLTHIELGANQLSGSIPEQIGNLSSLTDLILNGNQLTGNLPSGLFSLPVVQLGLSENQFSGALPPEIGNLTTLTYINLTNNQFSGPIPPEIGDLTLLTVLYLGYNQFSGLIPPQLGNLTSVTDFRLSNNQLTGPLPNTIGNLTQLTNLSIDFNQLSGSLPVEISNLTLLSDLFFQNNNFSGLPDLTSISGINSFAVSNNRFTFEDLEPNSSIITENFAQQNFGTVQNLNPNPGDNVVLSPPLPGAGVNDSYQWQKNFADIPGANNPTLDIISANLTDEGSYRLRVTNSLFPGLTLYSEPINLTLASPGSLLADSLALVALYNSTNGANWNNNSNWLTGPMDTWFGVTTSGDRVVGLQLIGNNLNGSIPPELGNALILTDLQLHINQLSGPIPPELGNLTGLTILDLGINQLSGTIPPELGNLTNLTEFLFAVNQLTGEIPPELGNLTQLDRFIVAANQLTGSVPAEFQNLTALTTLWIAGNQISELPNLSGLTNLDLFPVYNNRLTFEDLEPNIGISNFQYVPQDSVGTGLDTTLVAGADITLDLTVGGTNNIYQWFKGNVELIGETSNVLQLQNLSASDSGQYFLRVTNSIVPDLELWSKSFTIRLPGCPGNYSILGQDIACSNAAFSIPIIADNPIVADVIGLDFCLQYDPAFMTPTGDATLTDLVHGGNPNFADYFINTNTPGQLNGIIFFTGDAPFPSFISGQGTLLEVEFTVNAGINPGQSAQVALCGVTEATLTGGNIENCNTTSQDYSVINDPELTGSIRFWDRNGRPLSYDKSNPTDFLPTTIVGRDLTCQTDAASTFLPDLDGDFNYLVSEGDQFRISRDIPGQFGDNVNCTDVMSWINGTDQNRAMRIATLDPTLVPNVFQIIAADVNQDGIVSAADVTLIGARSVMSICGFPDQSLNPSEDWVFVDQTTIDTDPSFSISSTYPSDDGSGFSKNNVPAIPDCLQVPFEMINNCISTQQEDYAAILMGDVNGNWRSDDGAILRTKESNVISFQFDKMIQENGHYLLPVAFNYGEAVESLDMSFDFDSTMVRVEGILIQEENVNATFNVHQSAKFLYSSYTINESSRNGVLFNLQISSLNGPPNMEAFGNVYAFVNDEEHQVSDLDSNEEVVEPLEIQRPLFYPNPATDVLYIDLSSYELSPDDALEIVDLSGSLIFNVALDTEKFQLDLDGLKSGIYILRFNLGEKTETSRLILTK